MLHILQPGHPFPDPFPKGALVLIDKPMSWTSFDVVNKVRFHLSRRLGVKKIKVGHAGTLDPLATGLLILCIGEYTRKIETFQDMTKVYTGVLTFGATTASYDLEKPVDATFPVDHITQDLLDEVRLRFVGDIQQVPPVFSAVKVDGKRLYKNARTGQEVAIEPRTVRVESFELSELRPVSNTAETPVVVSSRGVPIHLHPEYPGGLQADFRVVCGKGTYIRSLVHDLGQALESGAYLSSLRRTETGGYSVDDAWQIPDLIDWIRGGEQGGGTGA